MARIDLTGQRFGRLIVLKRSGTYTYPSGNKRSLWLCKCDCGNTTFVNAKALKLGQTKSCGCLSKDSHREIMRKVNKQKQNNDMREHTDLSKLNSKPTLANTSGIRGVCWNSQQQKWLAYLKFKGVRVLNSNFAKKEDAIRARREAEEKYFKPILEKYHRDKE